MKTTNQYIKQKLGLYELKRSLIKHTNQLVTKQNVVMFHTGRCGSTVLGKTLNQHPDIVWDGEPFEPYMNKNETVANFKSVIINSRTRKVAPISIFAIKHLNQLHLGPDCLNMTPKDVVKKAKTLKGCKFILLERKNYLRRAVSAEVGRTRKQWHSKKQDHYKTTKVKLNVEHFKTGNKFQPLIELFDSMEKSYLMLQDTMKDIDYLHLTYEDDISESPLKATNKVIKFLNLGQFDAKVTLKKTNPKPLSEIITNYNEVCNYFKGTKYEWMLK